MGTARSNVTHDPPVGDASVEESESAAEQVAWRRALATLLFVVACWEVFLRVDSMILATATKAWLFPLLALALTLDGVVLGAAAAALTRATFGVARARRVRRAAVPWIVTAAAALEYALLAFHHLDGRVDWRVLAAIAVGATIWSAVASASVAPAPRAAARPRWAAARPRRVVVLAAVATAALGATLVRADVFYALAKRDTALGRVLGHGLAMMPPTLAAGPAPAAPATVPGRTALGRASVVLLSIDALRADRLAAYGAPGEGSPRLTALARESVVFTDAYTQSPNSAPSMATVLTGLYPFHHRVRTNRVALLAGETRLPEVLGAAGYATAAFVTNPFFAAPFRFERGFGTYRYLPGTLGPDGLVRDTSDPQAVEQALAWVREQPARPFFLWVHVMAPHSPYIPPDDLRPPPPATRGPWFDVWNVQAPEARLEGNRTSFDRDVYAAAYAAEVASADRLAGRLLDGLAAADVLDDAHVIVIADHGEAFGESDVFGHGRSLDRAETRVPLVWRLPRSARAARVTTTVQLADVMPTLLDILGIAAPTRRDGRDVAGIVLGEADDDGFAFTESRYLRSMGVRGLLYAARTRRRTLWIDAGYPYTTGFDRDVDPDEHTRRRAGAADPLYPQLATLARAAQDALASTPPKIEIDAAQRERLRALGYAQ